VDRDDWLATRFEQERGHLRAVAQRLLGSAGEADDAVQETWIRLTGVDPDTVDNLGGWLTTVVSRVALDMLRSRAARREHGAAPPAELAARPGTAGDPADEAELADSVGAALLVVLDTLSPAERLAFVLHDTFAVPFDEIAAILGRSPNATKQLAMRARAKVRGSAGPAAADPARQRAVVDAFLVAARSGDFAGLLALLDPEVDLRADGVAVGMGSPERIRGAEAVAGSFSGRARNARPALIDGGPGMVWVVGDRLRVAWEFVVEDGRIVAIDMLADPETLGGLVVTVLDGPAGG